MLHYVLLAHTLPHLRLRLMMTQRHSVLRFVSLFLLLLLSLSSAEIVELSNNSFEHLTQASTGQTTGKWMVKFYATWCGHCKKLEPVWISLDTELKDNHSEKGINVANVDAIQNRDLALRFQVRGYPTLMYFAKGKLYRYQGPRDLESLIEFVTEGYQTDAGEDVPAPPSWVEVNRKKFLKAIHSNRQLSMLIDDFEHIMEVRKNAAVVLILIGLFIGILVGYILGILGGSKGEKAKKD